MADWLNACVAIERATMVVMGVKFSKSKSVTASKLVIFFVILFKSTSAILDCGAPLNRRLIFNQEETKTNMVCCELRPSASIKFSQFHSEYRKVQHHSW